MKKIVAVFCVVSLLVLGCSKQYYEGSSREEAVSVVQSLDDFKEIVQTLKMIDHDLTGDLMDDDEIYARLTVPELEQLNTLNKRSQIAARHVVIYRTKADGFRIATLSSSRPPELTGLSKEFK